MLESTFPSSIVFNLDIYPGMATALCNPVMLSQVIMNLILNAVQACEADDSVTIEMVQNENIIVSIKGLT